ncbi:MAG: amidohydrolase [Clostridia bacterium]
MQEQLTARRRALHERPEIAFALYETRAYLMSQIAPWHARVEMVAQVGISVFFDAGRPDTYAFRSDMDALPIAEATHAPYASHHPGKMHACGHDGHMAMLLALGDWASAHLDNLKRNLLLVFQPAEESGGGGRLVVESGLLEKYRVSRAYALHVEPMLPMGVLASRPGAFMARASEVHVLVRGKSAHVARASEGADALWALCDFVTQALAFERAMPEDCLRLLKFGQIEAGHAVNVIAGEARLGGTMRTFDPMAFDQLRHALSRVARACEAQYGVTFDVQLDAGYPALVNDPTLFREALGAMPDFDLRTLSAPSMLAEDFGFYTRALPSLMLYVGLGSGIALHTDQFDFDERALLCGAQALIRLADAP